MTEQEWLASNNAGKMLEFLLWNPTHADGLQNWSVGDTNMPTHKIAISDRKLTLFACACGRVLARDSRNFHNMAMDERSRFLSQHEDAADGTVKRPPRWAGCYLNGTPRDAARHVAIVVKHPEFAPILRDIAGNPFRPVAPEPGYLGKEVQSLARAAYTERLSDGTLDPARLAVLSDALEELGCNNEDVLRHLRGQEICWSCRGEMPVWPTCDICNRQRLSWDNYSPWVQLRGPHYRGCWVLDLVLGNERGQVKCDFCDAGKVKAYRGDPSQGYDMFSCEVCDGRGYTQQSDQHCRG